VHVNCWDTAIHCSATSRAPIGWHRHTVSGCIEVGARQQSTFGHFVVGPLFCETGYKTAGEPSFDLTRPLSPTTSRITKGQQTQPTHAMYRICTFNWENKDDLFGDRLTEQGIYEWMLDREMQDIYAWGGFGAFCIESGGSAGGSRGSKEKPFFDVVHSVLGVSRDARGEDVYAAYKHIAPEGKHRLVETYVAHFGAEYWLKEVVAWCEENKKGTYDMCGNETLVGRIERI